MIRSLPSTILLQWSDAAFHCVFKICACHRRRGCGMPGLRPELLEPRWSLNSCSSALIIAYCVVVVVTSCSRTDLLLVSVEAKLSMNPLKKSMKSSTGAAPGGGTWVRPLFVAGHTACTVCAISWMCAAAFSDPKESAEEFNWRMTRSSTSCASWKWDFHFSQVWSIRGNTSNLGRSSGKIFLRGGSRMRRQQATRPR